MEEPKPINPHLSDLFKTALTQAGAPGDGQKPPQIVVHGSHNVISWGGTVYMHSVDDHPGEARL